MHDAIEIEWTTATERNCSHFEVEKSDNGIDFEKIATVKGHGNSVDFHRYTAKDLHPLHGLNYYRIKEVDHDGGYMYSKIVAAEYDYFEVKAFPNPTTGSITIQSDRILDRIEIADYLGHI